MAETATQTSHQWPSYDQSRVVSRSGGYITADVVFAVHSDEGIVTGREVRRVSINEQQDGASIIAKCKDGSTLMLGANLGSNGPDRPRHHLMADLRKHCRNG